MLAVKMAQVTGQNTKTYSFSWQSLNEILMILICC